MKSGANEVVGRCAAQRGIVFHQQNGRLLRAPVNRQSGHWSIAASFGRSSRPNSKERRVSAPLALCKFCVIDSAETDSSPWKASQPAGCRAIYRTVQTHHPPTSRPQPPALCRRSDLLAPPSRVKSRDLLAAASLPHQPPVRPSSRLLRNRSSQPTGRTTKRRKSSPHECVRVCLPGRNRSTTS